jgi:hypothetical protein
MTAFLFWPSPSPSVVPAAYLPAPALPALTWRAVPACLPGLQVKEVREVVREALPLYEALLAWGQQGGSAQAWQQAHAPVAAAPDGAAASPSPSPGAPSPAGGLSQRRLSFTNRAGSITERFR